MWSNAAARDKIQQHKKSPARKQRARKHVGRHMGLHLPQEGSWVLESLACRASLSEAIGKRSMARDLGLKAGWGTHTQSFLFHIRKIKPKEGLCPLEVTEPVKSVAESE